MKAFGLVAIVIAAVVILSICGIFSKKEKQGITVLTFLGAPGSGKGTIAEQCVKDLGFTTLSTGNLLREAVARGDELGTMAHSFMKEGKLVPDDVIAALVEQWFDANIANLKKLILDGYPRTEVQAKMFLDLLKKKYPMINLRVVEIVISDQAIIDRLADRLVCENKSCQAVYSKKTLKDQAKLECARCKGPLIRREDDKEEVVKERLKVYAQHAGALLNFYRTAGVSLIQLPVEGKSPDSVFGDFKKIL